MKSLFFILFSLFILAALSGQRTRPTTSTVVQSAAISIANKRDASPKFFDHFDADLTTYSARNAYLSMVAARECYLDVVGASTEAEYERLVRADLVSWGFSRTRFIRNDRTHTQCLIASNDAMVLIAFRGSEFSKPGAVVSASIDLNGWRSAGSVELPGVLVEAAVKDWVTTDAHIAPMRSTSWHGAKVHTGFGTAMESVIDQIIAELAHPDLSNKPIFVTGHSLGGALAILTAYRLKKQSHPVAACYPHAAPLVGDIAFSAKYAALGIPTFHTVHFRDFVPTFPSAKMVTAYNQQVRNKALLAGRKARLIDLLNPYVRVNGKLKYISRDGSIFTNPSAATVTRDQGPSFSFQDHDSFLYCLKLYNALTAAERSGLIPPPR